MLGGSDRKDFLKAFNKVHEGAQPTMDALDLETNWKALSPTDYYAQRIALSFAYLRALLWVRRRHPSACSRLAPTSPKTARDSTVT